MIDLHCHILPGLDDGARDLQDSLELARQAQADGIEAVCATPHIRHDHDVAVEQIAERVQQLQRALDEHGIDVRILPGGELAQTEADRLDAARLRAVTLGGAGGWVLLEPAPGPLDDDLEELVRRLRERGVRTVLAHPERHAGVDFGERVRRLSRDGCLIQWTAEFIAQAQHGGPVMELAREGLVHLLASDAHSAHAGRPLRLASGFASLASVCTPAQLAWSRDLAPRAIVRGETTLSPRPS